MPVPVSYPGVYVEEIPSGVRTITGVATSITAFVGRARKGPLNEAVVITSFPDFERRFGGVNVDYPMSYSVRDFYQNGGSIGVIVRVANLGGVSEDDRKKAVAAVLAVMNAIGGTADPAAAKKEAEDQKKKYDGDANATSAEKQVVTTVTDVARAAADANGATLDSIKAAIRAVLARAVPRRAGLSLPGDANNPTAATLNAANEGTWANKIRARVDKNGITQAIADRYGVQLSSLFNLTVHDGDAGSEERFLSLSTDSNSARYIGRVLEAESNLVRLVGNVTTTPVESDVSMDGAIDAAVEKEVDNDNTVPAGDKAAEKVKRKAARKTSARGVPPSFAKDDPRSTGVDAPGWDGAALTPNDVTEGPGLQDNKRGLYALKRVDLFNLLCLPPDTRSGDTDPSVYLSALRFCVERRAMLIVDSLAAWSANKDTAAASARDGLPTLGLTGVEARNAALFFPRVRQRDPMRDGQIDTFVPCGIIAGVMARTDAARGVWKAPAGLDASLGGIVGLEVDLTDLENGLLNPLGINCLRNFAIAGRVVWGSRTLRGADLLADEYKYIPVRRLALYIEESLYRGTQWVVFEPNDEPLWAQIRLNVGAFMHNLFRQGAFQGRTPREAYFVKCDKETTTQNDINLGIVNIVVGFAPLKPAEFVIIKLQQIAGQIEV